jgi:dephospho-CoA kinase
VLAVGLTGGIGSGKSTVSTLLAERGATIVDADLVVRELQQPGQPVLAAIVERFGPGVLAADGTLDRPALAAIVFSDPEALADLNGIVHPAVNDEIRRRVQAVADQPGVIVLDVPLLLEGRGYDVKAVIVVDVPIEVAVERLVGSRGMDEADVRARMARQATREERLAHADFVIDNSGDLELTRAQVDGVWEQLEEMAAAPTG